MLNDPDTQLDVTICLVEKVRKDIRVFLSYFRGALALLRDAGELLTNESSCLANAIRALLQIQKSFSFSEFSPGHLRSDVSKSYIRRNPRELFEAPVLTLLARLQSAKLLL